MKYRALGTSEIKVSEISLGCWTMGGLNWVDGTPNGWANVNEDEIVAAIKRGVDAGVNHFDNADVYGNGRAERMLARALQKLGLKSDDFVIATKVGHFPGTAAHAFDPLHIRHQCEQSLKNLNREYIDLYYLHHGDFGKDNEYLHAAADTLDALVAEGKIRLKGQSAYSDTHFAQAVPVVKPMVLQSWANALQPEFITPGAVVPKLLKKYGMSFVAFSPLAQGLMLDKFDPENPPEFDEGDHRKAKEKYQSAALRELRPKLGSLKQRFGTTTADLAAIAQRYVLNHPDVACVIPGFRNESQVACNLAAIERELSVEDIEFINQALT